MRGAAIVLSAALVVGLGGYVFWSTTANANRFLSACEEALGDRLRSPSTYKRIDFVEQAEPLAMERYIALKAYGSGLGKRLLAEAAAGKIAAKTHTLLITYDAANAYGTPIRGVATCEVVSENGTLPSSLSKLDVTLDGKTSLEWLTDQISLG